MANLPILHDAYVLAEQVQTEQCPIDHPWPASINSNELGRELCQILMQEVYVVFSPQLRNPKIVELEGTSRWVVDGSKER